MKNTELNNYRRQRYGVKPYACGIGICLLAALALTGCSSDNSLSPSPEAYDSGEISYNVTTENATRAVHIYNSNSLPSGFNLSAWAIEPGGQLGSEYIHSDPIKDTDPKGTHAWVDQNGVRYWPNNGEMLNFFASTSTSAGFADVDSLDPNYDIPFKVAQDAEAQTDLLYATVYRQKKTATGASGQSTQKVNLQFHHALAQIAFTAQCTNPHMAVYIGNISVVGPTASATFKVPVLHADGNPAWYIPANSTPGEFSASTFTENGAPLLTGTPVNLTAGADQTSEALMLIPQTVAAADPAQSNPWDSGKAYLKIDCIIYNVAKDSDSKESVFDTMIFGTKNGEIDNFDSLYIPISIDWKMGNRYIYNLSFGGGNGGYKSDGTAALIPVDYDMNVDSWTEAGTQSLQETTVR